MAGRGEEQRHGILEDERRGQRLYRGGRPAERRAGPPLAGVSPHPVSAASVHRGRRPHGGEAACLRRRLSDAVLQLRRLHGGDVRQRRPLHLPLRLRKRPGRRRAAGGDHCGPCHRLAHGSAAVSGAAQRPLPYPPGRQGGGGWPHLRLCLSGAGRPGHPPRGGAHGGLAGLRSGGTVPSGPSAPVLQGLSQGRQRQLLRAHRPRPRVRAHL